MALMEERKRKLAAEGLFDEARSNCAMAAGGDRRGDLPTGAVIRDILHRLQDRFPAACWCTGEGPGRGSPSRLRGHPRLQRAARGGKDSTAGSVGSSRGGGSLEDLWSFGVVVRAAADSIIPLISAVGHRPISR
jgi:exodeoxyribonuclease VII large subunit